MFGKKSNTMSGKPCKPYGIDTGNYFDSYFAEKEQDMKSRGRRK